MLNIESLKVLVLVEHILSSVKTTYFYEKVMTLY